LPYDRSKAMDTIKAVMARRNKELLSEEEAIINSINC
jgi:hypothetical protein